MDFGLAKAAAETRLTDPGQQMGTAAYMSPEQAEGEDVDGRTDLWALGAVLYEILAGERPFWGERRTAIIHSILNEEPAPLGDLRDEVSPGLEQVVRRCLQKDPEERYASADRLVGDLEALRSEADTIPSGGPPLGRTGSGLWGRWGLVGGAATILLILAVAAIWGPWPGGPTGSTAPGPAEHSVAVLPFEVSGSGAEDWRDGMVTALNLGLDGAAGLRAVADRTIFATLEERYLEEEGLGTKEALEVAREVGARYAIVGSALQLGGELRLSSAVHRTASGERLGQVEVRGAPDSAMTMASDLTRKVLGVLLEKSEEQVPSVRLESITTSSLPAFKAFLEGERHYRAGEIEAAAKAFEAAVQKDSTFALAYARLSFSKGWVEGNRGRQSLKRAYKLSDRLPRRERRLVRAQYLSRVKYRTKAKAAADTLRRLTEAYPDDPMIWYSLGVTLRHKHVPGGWPEADRAFKRAVELDPGSAVYYPLYAQLGIAVHHDSALAARRIHAIPKKKWREAYRSALNVAFGDSAAQVAALARTDSIKSSTNVGLALFSAFQNPVDIEHLEVLLRRSAKESDQAAAILFHVRLEGGQVKKALAQMQELQGRDVSPGYLNYTLARSLSLGIPVPDSVLQARLDPSQLGDGPSMLQLRATGLYLIEQEREGELGPLLDRIREEASQSTPVVPELKGYRAFRAGDLKRAAKLWARSGQSEFNSYGGIWRGDLYRRLGQLEKAEGWYQVAWRHPVAHERLGWLYEEMGKPKKAAAAHRRFIEGWKRADPTLQDRVQEARQRLNALGEKTVAE